MGLVDVVYVQCDFPVADEDDEFEEKEPEEFNSYDCVSREDSGVK